MKNVSILQKIAKFLAILLVFIAPVSFCQGYSLDYMANPDPDYNALYAVQVLDNNTAFAVGSGGIILKLSGGTWSVVPSSAPNKYFTGISAVSATDALIIGQNGYITRYDGSSCTQQAIGTSVTLSDIKRGSSKVYVCGPSGMFWFSTNNGTTWTQIMTGVYDVDFGNMFIDASGNVWLVAKKNAYPYDAKLYLYNGSSLVEKATITGLSINQGVGSIYSPDGNIFYLPSPIGIYTYDKAADVLSTLSTSGYSVVCGLSASNIIFSSISSGDISSYNGVSSWQNIGNIADVYDISASGPSNIIFVGYSGVIYHLDMTTGLNDQLTTASSFNVYPNPAQGDVTLDFNVDLQKDASVELYNSLGQKIVIVIDSDIVHLSVADLPRGLYYIRVSIGENSETKKILLN